VHTYYLDGTDAGILLNISYRPGDSFFTSYFHRGQEKNYKFKKSQWLLQTIAATQKRIPIAVETLDFIYFIILKFNHLDLSE
jgi:hypothetical protein